MKNLILTITLITISFIGFSQQLVQVLIELKQENTWEKDGRLLHSYDDNDFLTATISQAWNIESSSWENKVRTSYSRIKSGVSIENRIEHWNSDIGNWVIKKKTTFEFDENDKVVKSTNYNWQDNNWFESQMTHTYYDSIDNIQSKQLFYKVENEADWLLLNSYTYDYSDESEIDSYKYESPSKTMRTRYTRDDKGKISSMIMEDFVDDQWVINLQKEHNYHHAHGLDFTVSKLWLNEDEAWMNNTKASFLRDINGLIEQNIGYQWMSGKGVWDKTSRRTYTYKIEQAQVEKQSVAIRVYPNPTMKLIKVDNLTAGVLTIINSNGKQVYRSKNKDSHLEVNVQSFPEGYYFIRLNDESIGNFVKVN